MMNWNGTYTIVVKKNRILTVEKDRTPMYEKDVDVPHPNFENDPPPNANLKVGCIGLGVFYEPESGRQSHAWLWDSWW